MSDNDDISGSLSLSTAGESAFLPDIPREVLQGLYRSVLGTRDSRTSFMQHPKLVSLGDLDLLCERLEQWLTQYDTKAKGLRIVVAHKPKTGVGVSQRFNFSSPASLLKYDSGNIEPAANVEIKLTTIISSPDTGLNGSIDLNISLNGFINLLHIMHWSEFYDSNSFSDSIGVIRIEYTDYLVAKSLENVITDWHEELDRVEVPKLKVLSEIF